jgi:hypothetical protein
MIAQWLFLMRKSSVAQNYGIRTFSPLSLYSLITSKFSLTKVLTKSKNAPIISEQTHKSNAFL